VAARDGEERGARKGAALPRRIDEEPDEARGRRLSDRASRRARSLPLVPHPPREDVRRNDAPAIVVARSQAAPMQRYEQDVHILSPQPAEGGGGRAAAARNRALRRGPESAEARARCPRVDLGRDREELFLGWEERAAQREILQ
jgi:hypothetical protein